jgi:arginase family enzyme
MGGNLPRPIAIIGAPSSIGIKPYDDGTMRRLDLAPTVLREQGLVARLGARDRGDVAPPAYRDFARAPGKVRNEDLVERYSRALAHLVADCEDGSFLLVLGGDCSIVLGCVSGLRRKRERVGLVYIDAHADFATPALSRTGSAPGSLLTPFSSSLGSKITGVSLCSRRSLVSPGKSGSRAGSMARTSSANCAGVMPSGTNFLVE